MQGRKSNPETQYKVFIHNDKKYRYAAVQMRVKASKDGSFKNKMIHIGKIDENFLFIPNDNFKLLEELKRKILYSQKNATQQIF